VINFPRTSFLHRLLVKYALGKADHITATSKMLASTTAELTGVPDKVTVIPFGVDLLSFRERTASSQKMEITIGIVKTLLPKYGVEYLIRAFSLVEKQFRNLNLMIVGGGPLRDNLQRLAQELGCVEKVYFVGQVPYSRVPEYLSKMDIFVVPSVDESESFGVAAVEASACGLPVVASNVGGLPEVVLDNKTGLLVPPRDPFAIAEAIIYLIENPGMRERFGKCGRELVMKNYSWQENAQRMENLYKEIPRQS
jgi:glycosyltransferase involved in cell wall biosynthesis